jgi:predicted transcriptional regulator
MGKSLTEMASEIVAAQASHAVMAADEMVAALKKTFDALKNIKTIEEGGPEADAPPVEPRKSTSLTWRMVRSTSSLLQELLQNTD